MIASKRKSCRQIAGEIARRLADDDWTDRQAEPQDLEVPEYLRRKMEAA